MIQGPYASAWLVLPRRGRLQPIRLLKTASYAAWAEATDATPAKHNPGIRSPNWDLTFRLISIGCGKIDHLDSSRAKETAYRMRILTGRLQTNDRIHGLDSQTDAKFPRCSCPSETRSHFLACPANITLLPKVISQTKDLLASHMSTVQRWRSLCSNAANRLAQAVLLSNRNLLSSPTAKGIITNELINRVTRKLKARIPLQTRRLAAMYASDCLQTAICNVVWKSR
ncbi:hypothetical protein HK105_203113 [Polyrhizophydium stewartii]|uniref:Uncharacterized protein n=1 Tax=Polyrhizophydium stewartii TaxID=2732419 RepID=A0ABR4ND41_9FUNG|nr:hypothetical protein HK105_002903 [Polyrhizophydium stewartii]